MSYRDEVLADGPLAYWRFEETSGSPTADETGNGNDGDVIGANLDVDGAVGSGAAFDGTDDWINPGGPIYPDNQGAVSLEAFVYIPSVVGGTKVVLGLSSSDNNTHAILGMSDELDSTQRLFFDRRSSGTLTRVYAADFSIPLDTWVHIVGTTDASNNAAIYVQGVERATGTIQSSATTYDRSGIGVLNRGTGRVDWWPGRIDEVAVYDYELSGARIQAHYDAAFATADPANAYLIFRRTPSTGEPFTPGVDTPVAILPSDQLTYNDTDLTIGTYDWQVFARKAE